MVKLISTSVVRGSQQGDSHGGVYIIDLEKQDVRQVIDWNKSDIDWKGRGWDRGLRGIAIDGETVYIVASDELFAYTPDFKLIGSWRSPYLKHAHEMSIHERSLFITSTAYDSILSFDLDKHHFQWAMHVETEDFRFKANIFDPTGGDGPLPLNKLHLNNVHANEHGLYTSGLKSGGMLHFNGKEVNMSVTLPYGTHNAQPFRDGVVFNDSVANVVRYVSRTGEEDRAIEVPMHNKSDLKNTDLGDPRIARQGFGRGLCVMNNHIVAAGSSPSTISIHDIKDTKTLISVSISMDIRNSIHGLEIWPF